MHIDLKNKQLLFAFTLLALTLGASKALATSGSGLGTAVIAPANVTEGNVTTATVTFTVPTTGMAAGGQLVIALPQNWGPTPLQITNPAQQGYVSLFSVPGVSSTVTVVSTQPAVMITLGAATSTNTVIGVVFHSVYSACPPPNGNQQAVWAVSSAMTSSDTVSNLLTAPNAENYVAGSFQFLNFAPWTVLTVAKNQPSTSILLQGSDGCGQPVATPSALNIGLAGLLPDQQTTDTGAQFSTQQNFGTSTNTIQIPMSSTTTVFYYETSSPGTGLWIRGSYTNPVTGQPQQVWRQVNVLTNLFTFGSPSVDNGTPVTGQTSMTLSPDGDGMNDVGFIRFTPSDPSVGWHVTISSDNFVDSVYDRWGNGNPLGSLSWNGQDQRNGAIVPNGTYQVKLEVVGLTFDTSLSFIVNTAQISGSVSVGGTPVSQAWVSAQAVNGTGYSGAQTNAGGAYQINGLHSGAVYNLFTSFFSTTTQAQINSQILNVTAPASNQNFALVTPGVVRVSAVVPSSATATVYGNVNIHNSDFSQNAGGTVRLLAGMETSDNGDPFTPSTWTLVGMAPGSYTLELDMSGYGSAIVPVTVTANQNTDEIINLVPRATIYGKITLPAAAPQSIWVNVQGTPAGSQTPTVFGGASFNIGQSSAIYSIFSVNAGTYTFTAQIPNYIPLQQSNIVVGTSNIGDPINGGLDFSGFSTGGTISGTLTISGDTSGQTSPMSLWVSANSAALGINNFTQLQVATSTGNIQVPYTIGGLADGTYQIYPPYLSGFNSSQQNVIVSGGAGTANVSISQNTGKITGTITLPNGQSDYTNVHLSLQGPVPVEKDLTSGPSYQIKQLDTGFYQLIATYLTSGAQQTLNVAVTNGQTQSLNIDLSQPTYGLTGTVSVQTGFTMTNTTGSVVTVNTITDLLGDATNQTLTMGGMAGFGTNGFQCQGGTGTVVSTARVEAFPKNFNNFNQSNQNSVPNCYGVGDYKYGTINADGSFSIPGLTPGIWQVDVYPFFDNGQNPDVAIVQQTLSVVASTLTGVNFGLSKGNGISGTISLPTGVSDFRSLNLQVQTNQGDTVQTSAITIGTQNSPASSVAYSVSSLASGNYSILIQDPGSYDQTLQRNVIKYVAQAVQFQITGGDLTNINITLSNASRVVGKLAVQGTNPSDGSPTLTLITPTNLTLLPSNFQIYAQADPWVPSGYQQAEMPAPGVAGSIGLDTNNQFSIDGLIGGTYDLTFQQGSYGVSNQGQGSLNIAAYTQGGVAITQGQTLDLGTITLVPGLSISGTVTDQSGTPLANIPVRAQASNSQNGQNDIEVFTNSNGQFTIAGLSPNIKVYDFTAAPRPSPGDVVQPVPYGQVAHLAVDITKNPTLNFALPTANSSFSGKIVTGDGGALSYPDGQEEGYPAAAVYSMLHGDNTVDNPLGDENATALDGSFSIADLPAGVYDLTIECLGYQPVKLSNLTLGDNASTNLGTITLQRGAVLQATLLKPDGSAVNTSDVNQAVAASSDLSSIIFGQINSDSKTNNIISINFAGFTLAPKTYSVLLFDSRNNITIPPEGVGLSFNNNSDVVQRSLTYLPTPPLALANVQKVGSSVGLTYYFSRPLRNGPGDQDPTAWVSILSGNGTLSDITISGDRRQLKVTYNPATGEQTATLQFSAHTVDIDPTTGVEYVLSKTVRILMGQKATAEQTINPAVGGGVSLSDDLDPSNVSIPPNAFLNSDGSNTNATTSYALTFSATDSPDTTGSVSVVGSARLASMMQRGPQAYLTESYAAMKFGHDVVPVNPLSSFYSVLLPAGLSHTLNQTATLTLNYDTSADPTQINVYYFNGSEYLIEQNLRVVDTVNHTISVGVSHFSTFVVLQNNQPVITVDGDTTAGGVLEAFNFPNPFDLTPKTKTLTHGGSVTSMSTNGTIIRYQIPSTLSGPAKIDIFDIIGEKVASIDLGSPTTGTYNYVAWDGRNSSGKEVASGVYIGMLKVGGSKAFFKMAVIK